MKRLPRSPNRISLNATTVLQLCHVARCEIARSESLYAMNVHHSSADQLRNHPCKRQQHYTVYPPISLTLQPSYWLPQHTRTTCGIHVLVNDDRNTCVLSDPHSTRLCEARCAISHVPTAVITFSYFGSSNVQDAFLAQVFCGMPFYVRQRVAETGYALSM